MINLTEKIAPTAGVLSITSNNVASITFNEPVFKADGSTVLDISDDGFAVTISGGVATLTSTILAISNNNQTFTFTPTFSPTPNGSETLTIQGTVYDAAGNSLTLSGQSVNLIEKIIPTIQSDLAINTANTQASITFSESVFKSDKSTTLTNSELALTMTGGAATLSSNTLAVTNSNKTFTYTLTLDGTTPNGSEELRIQGTVYDAAGNSLEVNKIVLLNDKLAPAIE